MGAYKPETPTITPEEEEKSNVIGGGEEETGQVKLMGEWVPENSVAAQSGQSTALRKASGSIGKADEAYSERMNGRFRRGLLQRG